MAINRKKQLGNLVISLVLAVGGGYVGVKVTEKWILDNKYVNIVAIKEGHMVEPYTPILASDLTYFPISKDYMIPGSFTDPNKIIGKKSYQRLGELSPVLDWQLTDTKFLPDPANNERQYEFDLSEFGALTTVRTGDTATIWVVYDDPGEKALAAMNTGINLNSDPRLFEKTNNGADMLFDVRIAGIKDGDGAEVFSLTPPKLSQAVLSGAMQRMSGESDTNDRLAASFRGKPSTKPAKIVLNLTPEKYKILQEARLYGDWGIGIGINNVNIQAMIKDGVLDKSKINEGGRP